MVLFNYSTKELTAKIVYYGPGLCGKTTNLQFIYESLPGDKRGRMLSLSTQTDRTLYFDFLPMDLGEIRGMKTRIQLYTVPGQVFYNETRKMVLKGVDGVVFVADSQAQMADANVESFRNLVENLEEHGLDPATIPLVLQFNKRDLPSIQSVEEMNAALNRFNAPFYEAIATTGIGVHDTLKAISKLVLRVLSSQGTGSGTGVDEAQRPLSGASGPAAEPADEPLAATAAPGASEPGSFDGAPDSAAWDDDSLEDQLDGMDAAEIEGLLEEVEGLDLGESDALEIPASASDGGGPLDESPEPGAIDARHADTPDPAPPDTGGTALDEPIDGPGDDLFTHDPALAPGEGEPLSTSAGAGMEETAADGDGHENGADEIPSFETFMAERGDERPVTAQAEGAVLALEVGDGGQISIPVLLERDGRPVRYTLTLRLQPEDPARV